MGEGAGRLPLFFCLRTVRSAGRRLRIPGGRAALRADPENPSVTADSSRKGDVSALSLHAPVRGAQLERHGAGGGPGEEQRDADPDQHGGRAEDERLQQDPQRTQQEQNAREDGPARARNTYGGHVAAESDRPEPAQQQPESENDRQGDGR